MEKLLASTVRLRVNMQRVHRQRVHVKVMLGCCLAMRQPGRSVALLVKLLEAF